MSEMELRPGSNRKIAEDNKKGCTFTAAFCVQCTTAALVTAGRK